jgi:hypothetical protein
MNTFSNGKIHIEAEHLGPVGHNRLDCNIVESEHITHYPPLIGVHQSRTFRHVYHVENCLHGDVLPLFYSEHPGNQRAQSADKKYEGAEDDGEKVDEPCRVEAYEIIIGDGDPLRSYFCENENEQRHHTGGNAHRFVAKQFEREFGCQSGSGDIYQIISDKNGR